MLRTSGSGFQTEDETSRPFVAWTEGTLPGCVGKSRRVRGQSREHPSAALVGGWTAGPDELGHPREDVVQTSVVVVVLGCVLINGYIPVVGPGEARRQRFHIAHRLR